MDPSNTYEAFALQCLLHDDNASVFQSRLALSQNDLPLCLLAVQQRLGEALCIQADTKRRREGGFLDQSVVGATGGTDRLFGENAVPAERGFENETEAAMEVEGGDVGRRWGASVVGSHAAMELGEIENTIKALFKEQEDVMERMKGGVDDEMRARADLLKAAVDPGKRLEILRDVLRGLEHEPNKNVSLECPAKHELIGFYAPNATFRCDQCENGLPNNAYLQGCRICNYDLCVNCVAAKVGNMTVSPAEMTSLANPVIDADWCSLALEEIKTLTNPIHPYTVSVLVELTARSIFEGATYTSTLSPPLQTLARACDTVFNPNSTKKLSEQLTGLFTFSEADDEIVTSKRNALRRLLGLYDVPGAFASKSRARLVLLDAEWIADRASKELPLNRISSSMYMSLSLEELLFMAEQRPRLFIVPEFLSNLMIRASPDDGILNTTEEKIKALDRLEALSNALRPHCATTKFDFTVLYHRLKLDRCRRKPLLPWSAADATAATLAGSEVSNLPLLLKYVIIPRGDPLRSPANSKDDTQVYNNSYDPLVGHIGSHFLPPSVSDDVALLSSEIGDAFVWGNAKVESFSKYLPLAFLNKIWNENVTDIAKPVDAMSTPSISWCNFNSDRFTTNEAADVFVEFANVAATQIPLILVFEIDASRLYQATRKEIDTAINLDGLVPHVQFSLELSNKKNKTRERVRVVESGKRGLFVIEIVVAGVSSRVIVKKGSMRCVNQISPIGHRFFPFDAERGRSLNAQDGLTVELWVEGTLFRPEPTKDGKEELQIIVPFTLGASISSTAVLTVSSPALGSTSHVFKFERQASQPTLQTGWLLARESLLTGSRTAPIVLRPTLYIAGVKSPLALARDWTLTLHFTDSDGVTSHEVFHLENPEEFKHDIARTFKVIPNLRSISAVLKCALKTQLDTTLSTSKTWTDLNDQKSKSAMLSLFVRPCVARLDEHGYEVVVLGKTGEPFENKQLAFQATHSVSNGPAMLRSLHTDLRGTAYLGTLQSISSVTITTVDENISITFAPIRDVCDDMVSGSLRALESDAMQLCVALPWPRKTITPFDFTLIKVKQNLVEENCFKNLALSPTGTHIYARGLARGEYRLTQTFFIGASEETSVSARQTNLVVFGKGTNEATSTVAIADGVVAFIRNPVETRPSLTIGSVSVLPDRLEIPLSGGSTSKRRVHVIFRQFLERTDWPSTSNYTLQTGLDAPSFFRLGKNSFVDQRTMSEEIVYCKRRATMKRATGNLLPFPSLLVNERDLGATETRVIQAREGSSYKSVSEHVEMLAMPRTAAAARMQTMNQNVFGGAPGSMSNASYRMKGSNLMQMMAAPPPPNVQENHVDACLDFLASPSLVLANASPSNLEQGIVVVPLSQAVFALYKFVEIIGVDEGGRGVQKFVALTSSSTTSPFLDVRHRLRMDVSSHIVERQRVSIVEKNSLFEVGSIETAKFTCFDTLASFFDLAKALRPNLDQQLNPFAFLVKWNTLSALEKMKEYESHACVEVDFFLKSKDSDFFASVIRPLLLEKQRRALTLVERYLLDEDLSIWADDIATLTKLNAFEKALVAISLKSSKADVSRTILRRLQDECDIARRANDVYRQRAFQTAIQLGLSSKTNEAFHVASAPVAACSSLFGGGSQRSRSLTGNAHALEEGCMASDFENEGMASQTFDDGCVMDVGDAFSHESDSSGADDDEIVQRVVSEAKRVCYQSLGPARARCERTFWSPNEGANASRWSASFWSAYCLAKLEGNAFLSGDFCVTPCESLAETLLMLACLDAPFDVETNHSYNARRDLGELDFVPSCNVVVFHEQITACAANDSAGKTVLVAQSLFDPNNVRDEDEEEKEPVEILIRKSYGVRVSITNATSTMLRAKVLIQIPEGSIPISGGITSRTLSVQIAPFTTITNDTLRFYFPLPGVFNWFPVHVMRGEDLLAFTQPRNLTVARFPSVVDEMSWAHVSSRTATVDHVCSFLGTQNLELKNVRLDQVVWRFLPSRVPQSQAKEDWLRIVDALEKRFYFSPVVWIFSLLFGDFHRARAALSASNFVTRVGPVFYSPLLIVDAVNVDLPASLGALGALDKALSEVPEISPLVNARAHPLSFAFKDPSPNVRLSQVHHVMIRALAFRPGRSTNDLERLAMALVFTNENRIDEARRVLAKCSGSSSSGGTIAVDYLNVYLSFFVDEKDALNGALLQAVAKSALGVAEKHALHSSKKWRDRFAKVSKLAKEMLGLAASSSESLLGDAEDNTRDVGSSALKSPTFDAEVDESGSGISISSMNVGENDVFRIDMYKMNPEHLFSTKPFSVSENERVRNLGKFSYVRPAMSLEVSSRSVSNGTVVPFPAGFETVFVHVSLGVQSRFLTRFATALRVSFFESFGWLKVVEKNDGRTPIPVAYCKVYVMEKNSGKVSFHKDGYTSVTGEFDYGSLNTRSVEDVTEFAVFVSHEKFGALAKRVLPPSVG